MYQLDNKNAENGKIRLDGKMERTLYGLLKYAPDGQRLRRYQLCRLLGCDDRTLRRTIENMRTKGVRIASSSYRSGYWLCKTDEEYRKFKREYLSRVYKQIAAARMMDKNLEVES